MQVVIDISEDKIPWNLGGCTIEIRFCGGHVSQVIMVDSYDEESLYFTELPKGHGRLGDLDRLYNVFERNVVSANAFKELFDYAPTIIPANKEDADER